MKKFTFSLARLHQFKESVLSKEKLTLASMRAELRTIEDKLDNVNAQFAKLACEMKQGTQKGIKLFELQKLEYQIESSRQVIKALEKQLAAQKALVEQQLRVVMSVKSEVSGLEKLRDKQREEYDYAVAKEEAENIGELVSSQYARRSSQ